MTETLFPIEAHDLEPKDSDSSDRRRTKKAERMIAGGHHPFGPPLREPAGETCRTCVHATAHRRNKTYWKCPVVGGVTFGPGTDLRLKWPACVRWEQGVR